MDDDVVDAALNKLLVLLLVFSCSLFRLSLSRRELFCLVNFLFASLGMKNNRNRIETIEKNFVCFLFQKHQCLEKDKQ